MKIKCCSIFQKRHILRVACRIRLFEISPNDLRHPSGSNSRRMQAVGHKMRFPVISEQAVKIQYFQTVLPGYLLHRRPYRLTDAKRTD